MIDKKKIEERKVTLEKDVETMSNLIEKLDKERNNALNLRCFWEYSFCTKERGQESQKERTWYKIVMFWRVGYLKEVRGENFPARSTQTSFYDN